MASETEASESIPVAEPLAAPVAVVEDAPVVTPAPVIEPVAAEPVASVPTAAETAPAPAKMSRQAVKPPKQSKAVAAAAKPTPPVAPEPVIKAPVVKAKPVARKTAPAPAAVAKPAKAAPVATKTVVPPKIAPAPAPVKAAAPAKIKPAPVAAKPAAPVLAIPAPTIPIAPDTTPLKPSFFKETFAMTTPTFDFAAAFKTAFSDAQEKAKAAYEKSTVAMGDANEFAKGNVEAMVESTKILASGLQELTTELVAESREAFETLTAEVKTIAAVKSPADFFKLQSEMMRKQMDALMANGTKHSEAFLKLASDAAAPLSSRVSLAVEKVKTVA
jgi:hypothetical protein